MDDDILVKNAQIYAERHQILLAARLGSGFHGIIFNAVGNLKAGQSGRTAIKVHQYPEPFRRELAVYQRLASIQVHEILGFNVPQMLNHDLALQILEMTVVERPFVLDFAGAYLDLYPEFSDEVWEEWERDMIEKFGFRWPHARRILAALEEFDIHMIDVNPGNIGFAD
jgi:hypothetical protein